MNRNLQRLWLALFAGVIMTGGTLARADVVRTQTIQLQRGWNAVFLEVFPTNLEPASLFAGLPVSIVATYLHTETAVQYLRDPATIGWNREGWGVWYAANRADAFLSTLHAVHGNRTFLIQADQDCTWNIAGNVVLEPMRWKSDSFNLVGFCVDAQSPPTFEKFFSGSPAHRHYRIYRLTEGHWSLVTSPTATAMRAGEACWVHCKGGSDYMGPLSVRAKSSGRMVFTGEDESSLVVVNQSGDPATIQVQTVNTDAGVPLAYVQRGITDGRVDDFAFDLPASQEMFVLEAGQKDAFRLKVRRERMQESTQSTLLKISNGAGAQVWVPVVAQRRDLSTNP